MNMIQSINHHKKEYISSYLFDIVSIFITIVFFLAVFISIKYLLATFYPIFIKPVFIFKKPFEFWFYIFLISYFVITSILTTIFHFKYILIFNSKFETSQNGE